MDEQELHQRLYPEAHAKSEYIICAAIHFLDGNKYIHQPVNIEEGIVVCGRRHHNVFYTISRYVDNSMRGEAIEGFLTSKDRFVDRKEGGEIAFAANQIPEPTDCLFSEDLY